MKKSHFAITASATLLLLTVIGCAAPSDQAASPNSTSTQPNSTASTSPAVSPAADTVSPAADAQSTTEPDRNAANSADSPFMMMAAQGGMSEVELGQLAQQKASNAQVKQFAQQMVQDHGQANTKLMQVFQQKNITPPETIGAKNSAMREQVADLSGAEFDREYMSQMVEDHTEDVASFEREVSNGKDPEVKAWASQTLPTLRQHLQKAQSINQSLSGSTAP